jgi:signal transduction histidine kinase
MKDDPVAKLRHDLNNPLTSTKLLVDLLVQGVAGELNNQQKEMLKDIAESNEKMIQILKEFRDQTKVS